MTGTHVVVLGAAGQLGRQLVARLRASPDWHVTARDIPELDITNRESVSDFLTAQRPSFLINCAALTDLEQCEREPELAQQINGDSVAVLAEAANSIGATLVQLSTDYVFDGTQKRPYLESDKTDPLNAYAQSKCLGEKNAATSVNHLIVRTAWLHGAGGKSFLTSILERARQGDPLRVVDDQFGCPSFTPDVAEGLERLMRVHAQGVFHVVNEGSTSWHDLACRAVKLAGLSVTIDPISAADYGGPVRRPDYSVLDTTKYAQATGHRLQHWSDALQEFVRENA